MARIPSFAVFLRQIIPALNVRLRRAQPILGAACSAELVVATYQPARPVAVVKIRNCEVVEVTEETQPVPTRAKQLRGVRGPYEAVVAVLMGRLGWRKVRGHCLCALIEQLREFNPDLQVLQADVVLVDALFPVEDPSMPEYLE